MWSLLEFGEGSFEFSVVLSVEKWENKKVISSEVEINDQRL